MRLVIIGASNTCIKMTFCNRCRKDCDDSEFERVRKSTLKTKRCMPCREKQRIYDEEHRAYLKSIIPPENHKRCGCCRKIKPLDDFGGEYIVCLACRQHQYEHSKRAREYSEEIKKNSVCEKCGETDYRTFQYDHIGPKKHCIARLYSKRSKIQEMKNTRILCANCHATVTEQARRAKPRSDTRTANRLRKRRASLYEHANAIKLRRGCEGDFNASGSVCEYRNEVFPQTLCFDHVDRATKKAGIAQLIRNYGSREDIDDEIAKCNVLCQNCHQIRTRKQMGYYKDETESGHDRDCECESDESDTESDDGSDSDSGSGSGDETDTYFSN